MQISILVTLNETQRQMKRPLQTTSTIEGSKYAKYLYVLVQTIVIYMGNQKSHWFR